MSMRETIQDTKRNLDQIGGGHLVRDTDKQLRRLFDEENNRSILEFVNGKQILGDQERSFLTAERFRDGNSFNSSNNLKTFVNPNYPYGLNFNGEEANDESFMNLLSERDILENIREGDRRFVKNLDQIGGGHLVRNLNQIDGGNLVRNLDQIGGGHLVRNLHQIGGGHLVRNLDQIGGGNLVRSVNYPNGEVKQYVHQSSPKLHFARNLDQIGGGNLVRNLDHIGGGNLVRNLDHIGGGNLLRSLL